MPLLMGITNRHGVYSARKKVPPRLQEAVARVLNNGKPKQVWLKRSTSNCSSLRVRNMFGAVAGLVVHPKRTRARNMAMCQ